MGSMASNLGNSNVTDPKEAKWGDMDNSERGSRLLAGGVKGLGQGMQNTGQQPQGGGMPQMNPMQFGNQSPVSPDFFAPRKPNNNAFFGGQ